uniref:F-box domain-containing protein n=2 Tax=Macrostomum lignano TaxID=282301 RepID=A0A1I8HGK9_9PLAT
SIQDQLPAEVLERVLDNLLHLSDLRKLRLVNRRLCHLVDCLIERRKCHFRAALDGRHGLCWSRIRHVTGQPSPFSSLRLSAAVAKCGNYVYLFGGVSEPNQVPLNDLWRLSIESSDSECRWERVMSSGQFPEPRSHASLTCYANTQLVLFGGYLFHASPCASVVGDVHVLDTRSHRWQLLLLSDHAASSASAADPRPQPAIEPLTSHAACVFMRKYLLITGGLTSQSVLSDRIWLINLSDGTCLSAPHALTYDNDDRSNPAGGDDDNPEEAEQPHQRRYPLPRHNHAMEALDDCRVIICGGEVRPNQFCSEVWLLSCSASPDAGQSAILSELTWCRLAQPRSPYSPPASRYLTACLLPASGADCSDDGYRRLVCLSGAGAAYAAKIGRLRERTLVRMLAQQQRQRVLLQQQQASQRPPGASIRGNANQRNLMRLQRLQEYQDRLALLRPHHHRFDGPDGASGNRLRHSYLCPYVLRISVDRPSEDSHWLEVPASAGVSFDSAPLDLHRYTALACQHQLLLLNCFCALQRHFPVSHPFVQPVGLLSDDQQYRNAACEMFLLYPAGRT